ncbi:MAG TPA: hypothetical protein VNZ49_01755 [Bacteroidia bacterium]|jgi:hypothetical protein|nr:hypothetical protein [Bacteroidia bacterium]
MNVIHKGHPLKFINDIADQAQRENVSGTLLLIYENEKKSRQVYFNKPEIKKLIKEKKLSPYKPTSFDKWVMPYLEEKAHRVKSELQTYTSTFANREKVKTYINQQYSFIKNYHIKNFETYHKNFLGRGIKSDPLKAGIQIAYNIILLNIETDYKDYLENEKSLPPQQVETKAPSIKPIFKPETIQTIFDLLKDFFSMEHQIQLKQIFETGNNTSEHLIFLGSGNRLADAFKQLIKADIITGCEQKELENWIYINFKYRYRKKIKDFTLRYLNDIISTNKDLCQRPLLNVTKENATGNILISKA